MKLKKSPLALLFAALLLAAGLACALAGCGTPATGNAKTPEKAAAAPVKPGDTLHDRLAEKGANLLVNALEQIEANNLLPVPQDHNQVIAAPLLKKEDGRIDWTLDAERIEAFIRGMTPWPGAFTFWGEKCLKLFKAKTASMTDRVPPGTIIQGFQDELRVSTGKGALSILEIQGSSGKRLHIRDFLRGSRITPGMVFT